MGKRDFLSVEADSVIRTPGIASLGGLFGVHVTCIVLQYLFSMSYGEYQRQWKPDRPFADRKKRVSHLRERRAESHSHEHKHQRTPRIQASKIVYSCRGGCLWYKADFIPGESEQLLRQPVTGETYVQQPGRTVKQSTSSSSHPYLPDDSNFCRPNH